jgi:general secretion pathway protein M
MNLQTTLPEGRRGQAAAVAMLSAAAGLIWLAVVSPLQGWYQSRAAQLAQQQALAQHMEALRHEIPALREAIAKAGAQEAGAQMLLSGGTDTVAGANLQSALQNLATQAGTGLDSAALLPAQPAGSLRRISMQVSLTAAWPALIALLAAIEEAHPGMVVNDISLSSGNAGDGSGPAPVQANFTVSGFRAAGAP